MKNKLRRFYALNSSLRSVQVDIILPTYNRANKIKKAINSVTSQLHKSWNLHICDDGSTDSTAVICETFINDSRINYIKLPHKGVSATRNVGLNLSKGEILAFIDSDNEWLPEYLSLMIAFQKMYNLSAAYCACLLSNEENDELIWLGNHFDWDKCLELNYIDLNGFIYERECAKAYFDKSLKRFVDWDYILKITKHLPTAFLDCGLIKYDNGSCISRISNQEEVGDEKFITMDTIRKKHST